DATEATGAEAAEAAGADAAGAEVTGAEATGADTALGVAGGDGAAGPGGDRLGGGPRGGGPRGGGPAGMAIHMRTATRIHPPTRHSGRCNKLLRCTWSRARRPHHQQPRISTGTTAKTPERTIPTFRSVPRAG